VTTSSEVTLTLSSFPEPAPIYDGDLLWSSTSTFIYESSLVNVTLGRRVWALRQPAYGFNGIVQGAIKLSRKCTHVVRVEVSVKSSLFIHRRGAQLIDVFGFTASGESQDDFVRQRIGL
jgi:hypothetical protein